jgi:hypothetical protein
MFSHGFSHDRDHGRRFGHGGLLSWLLRLLF